MLGLQTPFRHERWPDGLPYQTRLQESIHGGHETARNKIVRALWDAKTKAHTRWALSMSSCCTGARFAIDPAKAAVQPYIHRCKSRLCPLCSNTRSGHVAKQIADLIAPWTQPRHIVLTVKSHAGGLAEQLRQLTTWFAKLRRTPEWKRMVKGGVYTLESTVNGDTGFWHPHLHILAEGLYFPVKLLQRLWHDITGGSQIVWVEQVYDRFGASKELAKYIGKPQHVAEMTLEQIAEYAAAVHGRRMVQTFGTAHHKTIADEDPSEEPSENAYTVSLSRLMYLARQGELIAQTLVLLIGMRWKIFHGYVEDIFDGLTLEGIPPPDSPKELIDKALLCAFTRYHELDDAMAFDQAACYAGED